MYISNALIIFLNRNSFMIAKTRLFSPGIEIQQFNLIGSKSYLEIPVILIKLPHVIEHLNRVIN